MKRRILTVATILLFTVLSAAAQESSPGYEDYLLRIEAAEALIIGGGPLSEADLPAIEELKEELNGTAYRDLYNKAGILLYLARQHLDVRSTGTEIMGIDAPEKKNRDWKGKTFYPALITGGLSLIVSDLAFSFSDSAYSRYISSEDAEIGGYYQQVSESLAVAGIIGAGMGFISMFWIADSLTAAEFDDTLGTPEPVFVPPDHWAVMDSADRLSAIDEEIRLTAEQLARNDILLRRTSTANKILLTVGSIGLLTTGICAYLTSSARDNMEANEGNESYEHAYELYSHITGGTAAGSALCFTGSLLIRLFRPEPEILQRRLTELEAYKLRLEQRNL